MLIEIIKRRLVDNRNPLWKIVKKLRNYKCCRICDGARFRNSSVIDRGTNNCIIVKTGAKVSGCKFVFDGSNNSVTIGKKVVAQNVLFYFNGEKNAISIGEKTTFTDKAEFSLCEGTRIMIGNDCMFAYDIIFRTSDFHSILDEDGKRINQSKDIIIGNHVWVGQGAYVLKGTVVPDNCIIGAKALVSKSFSTEYSVIAGVPADIIKTNVTWMRDIV